MCSINGASSANSDLKWFIVDSIIRGLRDMKVLIVILVALLAVGGYVYVQNQSPPPPTPTSAPAPIPVWQQPLPDNMQKVDEGNVDISITPVRVNKGKQAVLEFHITEKHGYMVDGIKLRFWYKFKDEDSGEWIEDTKKISHFVNKRLEPNETLIDSTVLIEAEFKHLAIDLTATATENWSVEFEDYMRAGEPKK